MANKPPYGPPGLFPGGAPTPAGGGDPYYAQRGQLPHDQQAVRPGPYIDSQHPWPDRMPSAPFPRNWSEPRKPWSSGNTGKLLTFLSSAQWAARGVTLPADTIARAQLESPIFNLRPEFFETPSGNTDRATVINRYNAYGNGATYHVAINGVGSIPSDVEMRVHAFDLAHPSQPSGLFVINDGEEITSDFFATSQAALLSFSCPTGPPAFWRVRIVFDLTSGTVDQVTNLLYTFEAAY